MSAIYDSVFRSLKGKYVSLGEISNINKGKQLNGEMLSQTGEYYVMNGGIQPSGYYHSFNVLANTISISEGGNSCGYIQWNKAPFWSGGHCYTLQLKKSDVSDKYLYHFLKWKEGDIMQLRVGSGLPNIQKKDLANVQVIIPTLSIAAKVASLFDSIDAKTDIESSLLNQYNSQKEYLLSQMFI